jgi:hypothetical protein
MIRFAAWTACAAFLLALAYQPGWGQCMKSGCCAGSKVSACPSCTGSASSTAEKQKSKKCCCDCCAEEEECSADCCEQGECCPSCCQKNKTAKTANKTQKTDDCCCDGNCQNCIRCPLASIFSAFGPCPLPTLLVARETLDLQGQIDELRDALREMQQNMDETAPMVGARRFIWSMPSPGLQYFEYPNPTPFLRSPVGNPTGMDRMAANVFVGPGPCPCPMESSLGLPPISASGNVTCGSEGKCCSNGASAAGMPPAPMMQAAFAIMNGQSPGLAQAMGGAPCCTMQAVEESGHYRIGISCCGENWATCDHLVLNCCGNEHIKVTAGEKQVALSGPCMHATADRVIRMTRDNCIMLDGHVRCVYHKEGERAEISADHVTVGLADGRLEVTSGHKAPNVATVGWKFATPVVPSGR